MLAAAATRPTSCRDFIRALPLPCRPCRQAEPSPGEKPTHSGEEGRDRCDQEKREKDEKQYLRDAGCGRRYIAEAQKARDDRHEQKQERPEEHADSSFFM